MYMMKIFSMQNRNEKRETIGVTNDSNLHTMHSVSTVMPEDENMVKHNIFLHYFVKLLRQSDCILL